MKQVVVGIYSECIVLDSVILVSLVHPSESETYMRYVDTDSEEYKIHGKM